MAHSLDGKTAIVTGAAHGVGRAIARRFSAAGARLVITDRDEEALDDLAALIAEEGGEATAFACNLGEKISIANLMASAVDAYGSIDILVNAMRKVAAGDIMDTDSRVLSDLFDMNVRAVFQLSQAVAKRMIQAAGDEKAEGAIVNITSIAARRTLPELLCYSVSCAALDQMTRSMAVAMAPKGIRVNAVALGGVMTASLQEALRADDSIRDRMIAATPLGRIGEAAEAAEAALFLASGAASFITGQILAVDGGRTSLDPLAKPAV
jgi:7-alpha-hydroxysteroid dehydrogenase